MTDDYNIAAIRQLLLAAFTPEDLRRFCEDHPDFRPVLRRFGPGQGHDDMVDELISYCKNFRFFPELLAEVKQVRSRQYEHIMEPAQAPHDPARPTSQIVTTTSPFRLDLVRVPAGEFRMGSDVAEDENALDNELPPHRVYVPEFKIGKYPVTNGEYHQFVNATGHRRPAHWNPGKVPFLFEAYGHAVTYISWEDALAFCAWLAQESGHPVRLPTEAEWEKAARGTDGRIYPWGNQRPDEGRCNSDGEVGGTTMVERYSRQGDSPYGCADMAGNVWEWCQSLYKPYPYHSDDGREDLETDGSRVIRGGAFLDDERDVRCTRRTEHVPDGRAVYLGFRVVVDSGCSQP